MGPICKMCGYDEVIGPEVVDEHGLPFTCPSPFHLPRAYWAFGDIIRVDPKTNPKVPQPDDRRWMVLTTALTSANRQWTLMFVGPESHWGEAPISHWSSMFGFERVEEAP